MKKVTGLIKLQVPAGKANPSPPVGPALGRRRQHHGVLQGVQRQDAGSGQGRPDHPGGDHRLSRIARSPSSPRRRRPRSCSRRPPASRRARGEPNKNKVGKVTQEAGPGHRAAEAARPQHHQPRAGDAHHRGRGALDGPRDRRSDEGTEWHAGKKYEQGARAGRPREEVLRRGGLRAPAASSRSPRSSTRPSTSRSASASIPSTPTRWCAAR